MLHMGLTLGALLVPQATHTDRNLFFWGWGGVGMSTPSLRHCLVCKVFTLTLSRRLWFVLENQGWVFNFKQDLQQIMGRVKDELSTSGCAA